MMRYLRWISATFNTGKLALFQPVPQQVDKMAAPQIKYHFSTLREPQTTTDITPMQLIKNYSEYIFMYDSLIRRKIFGKQLFKERPYENSGSHSMEDLATDIHDAVSKQDFALASELCREIPVSKEQLTEFYQFLHPEVSGVVMNWIKNLLDAEKKAFVENLELYTQSINYIHGLAPLLTLQQASQILERLFSTLKNLNSWFTFEEYVKTIQLHKTLTIQRGNITGRASSIRASTLFTQNGLTHAIPRAVNSDDLMALCFVLYRTELNFVTHQRFVQRASRILMSDASSLFRDIDPLAFVSLFLFTSGTGLKNTSRDLLTLTWEVVSQHIKNLQGDSLPFELGICLKEASWSMDKVMLKTYPYMLADFFENVGKILPKLSKLSIPMSVRVAQSMVKSRFVDVEHLEMLINSLKTTDWSEARSKEVCSLLQCIADYGYNDIELYKMLLEELLTKSRLEVISIHPRSIMNAALGLSYVNIYPKELYKLLFSALPTDALYNDGNESTYTESIILYLHGCVDFFIPDYDGPRLSDATVERYRERVIPKQHVYTKKDGTPSEHVKMARTVMDTINSQPHLAEVYVTQITRVLDCVTFSDVLMKKIVPNDDPSFPDVAIMIQNRNYFLNLYTKNPDKPSEKMVSRRLLGVHRARKVMMEKRGYKVVQINNFEYADAPNKTNYILTKLKEAGVI